MKGLSFDTLRKLLIGCIIICLGAGILIAQGGGTPSTLRVLVDASNNLVVSSSALSGAATSCVFSNCRLRTDASGNLVITDGSGAGFAPANATYITQTPSSGLSAEQALSLLSTGILHSTTTTGVIDSLGDVLGLANGGLGFASGAVGDLLYLSGTTTPAKLPDVAVGQVLISGGVNTAPAYSANPVVTTATSSIANLIAVSTDGFILQNPTAATAGVPVQQSPRLRLRSNVWNTTATAATNTDDWWIESVPVSGTTPSGLLKFGKSLNGGATTFPMTLATTGSLTLAGGTLTVGNIVASSAATISWSNRAVLTSPADGQFNVNNFNINAGVGFDVATDALLKIRTRAQTGDAAISVAYLQGAGTGVSVANVGANSCGTTAATIAGNQLSGVITVGATSGTQCRVTFSTAAPVARDCTVTDSTTTIATRATVVDTTNTDFLGAFVAGDKVTYQCTVR